MNKSEKIKKAFAFAFPKTIPIMTGFIFLGMSYGVYMSVSGFDFRYPMLMSLLIYGGSLEFMAASMLLSPFAPLEAFLTALTVQARHIFYGISMLDKYRGTGWKKPYLIFGLCDETFTVNYSTKLPPDIDKGWFYLFVTLLNQIYWVAGASAGGLIGKAVTFNTKGLDFVMTAMFAVIFTDRLLNEKNHASSVIGLASSVICLIVFGKDNFLIPSMICILVLLTMLCKKINPEDKDDIN